MNKIPKFLLPGSSTGKSLLEIHIENALDFYERILIGTRPELIPLLDEKKLGGNVDILPFETSTMTETVMGLIKHSEAGKFGLVMPDTFFLGENPHVFLTELEEDLRLALWNIRDSQRGKLGQVRTSESSAIEVVDKDPTCELPNSWGALSFTRNFSNLFNVKMPHVGYAIPIAIDKAMSNKFKVNEGQYFDCGTPSEYFELIKNLS